MPSMILLVFSRPSVGKYCTPVGAVPAAHGTYTCPRRAHLLWSIPGTVFLRIQLDHTQDGAVDPATRKRACGSTAKKAVAQALERQSDRATARNRRTRSSCYTAYLLRNSTPRKANGTGAVVQRYISPVDFIAVFGEQTTPSHPNYFEVARVIFRSLVNDDSALVLGKRKSLL